MSPAANDAIAREIASITEACALAFRTLDAVNAAKRERILRLIRLGEPVPDAPLPPANGPTTPLAATPDEGGSAVTELREAALQAVATAIHNAVDVSMQLDILAAAVLTQEAAAALRARDGTTPAPPQEVRT